MKNVISFSGGRTSAYLCYLAKQGLIEDPAFVFCDTGAEHPETYDFVRKCNDYFDLNLVCLRAKVTHQRGVGNTYNVVGVNEIGCDLAPFRESSLKYSTPTVMGPKCTDRLKSTPSDKWCDDIFGKGYWKKWLGIRCDEQNRLGKVNQQNDIFLSACKERKLFYLAEISDFTKQDVIDWWAKMPFDLGIDEHLGNCVFCIKKGDAKLALAARQEPDLARMWMDMLNSPEIPKKKNNQHIRNNIIYRNHNSLESIIAKFSDFSEDELKERIYKTGGGDTGSCSESCEAFADNYDFFED